MSLRRFRLLLPPTSYLVLYVLLYLLANLPALIVAARRGVGAMPNGLNTGRMAVLIAGLVLYGAFRAFAFHPAFRPGYRAWLETTPWTWRKPLPVGPVRPVWEDAAIISALAAPAWYFGEMNPLAAFALAMGGYLMALSVSFSRTGAWGFQYAVSFAVGLAVRVWDGPSWGYSGAIGLGLAFGLVGLGRSLKRWPWPDAPKFEIDPARLETSAGLIQAARAPDLGWPFDRLGPLRDGPEGWRKTLSEFFTSLLVGWWLYALMALISEVAGRAALGVMSLAYLTIFLTIFRVSRYVTGYASPLDLGGRVARLRPIVPSYDQIYIAPIVAVMAACGVPPLLIRAGVLPDASLAIALALMMMALRLGGPDHRRWQLTARLRVVPGIGATAKQKGGFVQVG